MTLTDDAWRLAQLDRQVVAALMENDAESLSHALGAYLELRKDLKARMIDESVMQVEDSEAAEIFRKISGGEGLHSDKIMASVGDKSIHDFEESDFEELGQEVFYSSYSHYEYILALSQLRPLILPCEAPASVIRLMGQVKSCYAFQQYDAAYCLCRTLLEACIRDICERCNLIPNFGPDVVLLEKYSWRQMRDKISSGALREKLRDLYGRLCEVLHARRAATANEARIAFEETLDLIEELYRVHGL